MMNPPKTMKLTPEAFLTARSRYLPLLMRLESLFNEMDRAYAAVADRYGFRCNGCTDNCCLTRFFHHTLLEYLYLMEGVQGLAPDARHAIIAKARAVNDAMAAENADNGAHRSMCPLNNDGRCALYPYRPMICRLHGIPHELHRPGGEVVKQPGCDAFFAHCRHSGKDAYIPFDRTPFYRQMAMLEKELRFTTGYTDKIKLSIAQMLVTIAEETDEID
jgi:Fe-S-cluster containining protein